MAFAHQAHKKGLIMPKGRSSSQVPDIGEHAGIDVSKKTLVVGFHPSQHTVEAKNDASGVSEVVQTLARLQAPKVIVEASGGYETSVADALDEAGIFVAVVNPTRTHHYIRGVGNPAKTDRRDAVALARYGAEVNVRRYERRSPEFIALKELVVERCHIAETLSRERIRSNGPVQPGSRYMQQRILFLRSQLREIERDIAALIDASEALRKRARILMSCPGVGLVGAATLIALVPEMGKATNSQVVSLLGLAPETYESGPIKRSGSIHGGRHRARRILHMCTVSALRWNPPIGARYRRLRGCKKEHKVAVTACARQLIVTLNSMLRHGEEWDENHAS